MLIACLLPSSVHSSEKSKTIFRSRTIVESSNNLYYAELRTSHGRRAECSFGRQLCAEAAVQLTDAVVLPVVHDCVTTTDKRRPRTEMIMMSMMSFCRSYMWKSCRCTACTGDWLRLPPTVRPPCTYRPAPPRHHAAAAKPLLSRHRHAVKPPPRRRRVFRCRR